MYALAVDFNGFVLGNLAVADRVRALTRELAIETEVSRTWSAGLLPADVVTPLAMVIAELLSNAVQHGVSDSATNRMVTLSLERTDRRLTVEVADNGNGLPADFDPNSSSGLGLKIVKTLVTEELSGAVTWEPRRPAGTRVVVDVLLP